MDFCVLAFDYNPLFANWFGIVLNLSNETKTNQPIQKRWIDSDLNSDCFWKLERINGYLIFLSVSHANVLNFANENKWTMIWKYFDHWFLLLGSLWCNRYIYRRILNCELNLKFIHDLKFYNKYPEIMPKHTTYNCKKNIHDCSHVFIYLFIHSVFPKIVLYFWAAVFFSCSDSCGPVESTILRKILSSICSKTCGISYSFALPASITNTRSESMMVCSLWATVITVKSLNFSRMVFWIRASVWGS